MTNNTLENISTTLSRLGIKDLNYGTSTGSNNFGNGEVTDSFSPVDGKKIGSVSSSTKDDYEQAINASVSAFEFWRNMPAPKRGEIVRQYGEKLRKYKQPLGELVSYEMGKSMQEGSVSYTHLTLPTKA